MEKRKKIDIYIKKKKGGIRADGEQKVKKQLCVFLYEVMNV